MTSKVYSKFNIYALMYSICLSLSDLFHSENSIETCTLPHLKQMTSASSMHEAGHSTPVHWDNPERGDGEGGGSRVQEWGGHICIRG